MSKAQQEIPVTPPASKDPIIPTDPTSPIPKAGSGSISVSISKPMTTNESSPPASKDPVIPTDPTSPTPKAGSGSVSVSISKPKTTPTRAPKNEGLVRQKRQIKKRDIGLKRKREQKAQVLKESVVMAVDSVDEASTLQELTDSSSGEACKPDSESGLTLSSSEDEVYII